MALEQESNMIRPGYPGMHLFQRSRCAEITVSGARHALGSPGEWPNDGVAADSASSKNLGSFRNPRRALKQAFSILIISLFSFSHCQTDDGKQDQLLTGFLIAYAANPCNFQARPQLSSVSPSGNLGWPIVKGRVLQSNGDPVIGALVIAEDLDADGASDGPGKRFVSTFSGIDGTGTFYMSGLPNTADDYRISVEPIDPTYDGRIDQHIDCFQNPSSFSAGYYTGPGSTVNRNTGSATSFSVTMDPSSVYDVGDIYIR
ncbi:MAG: carboxypeptidase regulatory-like domain-containing protein [Leptospiraceae bacterium]|nr:carboxypeptidase regulatory-like domain-containing protein [Leptospiraceae bacterium]